MFKFQYFSIVFPSIFIPAARRHKHQNPIQIQKSLLPVGDVTDFIKELSQPIFKGEVHPGTFVQIAYDVRTLSRKTESSISNSGAAFRYHGQKRFSRSPFPQTKSRIIQHHPCRFLIPTTPPVLARSRAHPEFDARRRNHSKGAIRSGGSPAP